MKPQAVSGAILNAGALNAGAQAGLSIPTTEMENQWLAETVYGLAQKARFRPGHHSEGT
jgi:hypothetical protein